MASAREMRLRIRSVKNISQVTRALRRSAPARFARPWQAVAATRPYATKAWQVLTHIAGQPGRDTLHPLLTKRTSIKNTLVVVVSGDRGLAGAYNTNLIRFLLHKFRPAMNSGKVYCGRSQRPGPAHPPAQECDGGIQQFARRSIIFRCFCNWSPGCG